MLLMQEISTLNSEWMKWKAFDGGNWNFEGSQMEREVTEMNVE